MGRVRRRNRVFEIDRRIDAPVEATWDVLIDTERWPEWGPSVRSVACADRRIRDGSTGRIRTVGGVEPSFEITTFESHRWAWRVARIPATGHRVERLDRGCRVVFELPALAAGYAPVYRVALSRIGELVE